MVTAPISERLPGVSATLTGSSAASSAKSSSEAKPLFATAWGLRGDLPRYEISALKLLDQEDRYCCTIEMRTLAT